MTKWLIVILRNYIPFSSKFSIVANHLKIKIRQMKTNTQDFFLKTSKHLNMPANGVGKDGGSVTMARVPRLVVAPTRLAALIS